MPVPRSGIDPSSRRPGLGLVGLGAFGSFLAVHLRAHFEIVAFDRRDLSAQAQRIGIAWGPMAMVARQPLLVLAVPVQDLEAAASAALGHLPEGVRVFDVASVKTRPLALLDELLPPFARLTGLHPMFGPQSGKAGIRALKVVVCQPPAPRRPAATRALTRFLGSTLELMVLEMSPERHDREMAYIQGLTHWFAKALREVPLPNLDLATPAYRHMMQIEEILREDSDDLFLTIQRENPHARQARDQLRRRLDDLERWIAGDAGELLSPAPRRGSE